MNSQTPIYNCYKQHNHNLFTMHMWMRKLYLFHRR